MAYKFYENIINNAIDTNPNQMYRDLQQAFVSLAWDNTSTMFTLEEQDGIGIYSYHDIEAWVTPTVADTTRGMVDTHDFLKIVFECIDHKTQRGLMYKFDNNYWLVHSYAPYNGIVQDCGIRKCNNTLKMIDPISGAVFGIPCIVDYDMSAPSTQVSRYIITPNNHAVVMVQGNTDTLRLFKTNTRFMLSGRPFKLYGYQNAVEYDAIDKMDTLLYLDLYLDELRDGDDLINGIADNGEYEYSLSIHSDDMTLPNGSIGTLSVDVLLNDVEVQRNVVWSTSNKRVLNVDAASGEYKVIGANGASAMLTCSLLGNPLVRDEITITVGEVGDDNKVVMNPSVATIRQYQSIPFDIQLYHNGELLSSGVTYSISLNSEYISVEQVGDKYVLSCNKIAPTPQTIVISAECNNPPIDVVSNINIKTVSMIG